MYELKVQGMTCGHCAASITRAILDRDRDARVEVDVKKGRVRVKTQQAEDTLRRTIEDAGYQVVESARV